MGYKALAGRKAALGFKYLSLDGEFRIPTSADIELAAEAQKRHVHAVVKATKLRCYTAHADKYNQQKRSRQGTVLGRYSEARRQAIKVAVPWDFTPETWERMWQDAGWVIAPGSQKVGAMEGVAVPAYALRGAHRYNNTCMVRKDLSLGWSPENCSIMFRGNPLCPGSRWYLAPPVAATTD